MVAIILGTGQGLFGVLALGNSMIAMIGLALAVVLVKALHRPARPGGMALVGRVAMVIGLLAAVGAVGYAASMITAIVYFSLVGT